MLERRSIRAADLTSGSPVGHRVNLAKCPISTGTVFVKDVGQSRDKWTTAANTRPARFASATPASPRTWQAVRKRVGFPHTGSVRRRHAVAVVLGVVVLALTMLVGAGAAAADIVVEPDNVEPGARDVTLAVRMTPEVPGTPAVRLQLLLPTARPLVGVRAPAPPGWTVVHTTAVLDPPAPSVDGPVRVAVTAIDWTATAPQGDGPVVFAVHVDLMPDGAGPVRFRAVQTDAGGRAVEWSDIRTEGARPPAHGSLVVRLGAAPPPAAARDDHGGQHGGQHGDDEAAAVLPGRASPSAVAVAVGALLACVAAVAALVVVLGRRQQRRFAALRHAEREAQQPEPER